MNEVYLTEEAHEFCVEVARQRMNAAKIRTGVGVFRGTYDPLSLEIVGAKAEFAASWFYGLDESLDFVVYSERADANREDLSLTDQDGRKWKLSVKGTLYPRASRPRLMVPVHNHPCHAYVLVHATPSGLKCEMLGVASRAALTAKAPVVLYEGAPRSYILGYDELRVCQTPGERAAHDALGFDKEGFKRAVEEVRKSWTTRSRTRGPRRSGQGSTATRQPVEP